MRNLCLPIALCLVLLPQAWALAETLPYYEVTANGTWDCQDPAGSYTGTVVLAEDTYAFLKGDGRLSGYGKLHLLSFDTYLPNFAIISGPLKEEFGAEEWAWRAQGMTTKTSRESCSSPLPWPLLATKVGTAPAVTRPRG